MATSEINEILAPITNAEALDVPLGLIQDIVFRLLFNEGAVNVGRFAEQLGLSTRVLDDLLSRMKQEHLVEIVKAGTLGSLSFTYSLTDAGAKRARDAFERSQ
jgi:Mn-dependent DtxR family transcriptional regulator